MRFRGRNSPHELVKSRKITMVEKSPKNRIPKTHHSEHRKKMVNNYHHRGNYHSWEPFFNIEIYCVIKKNINHRDHLKRIHLLNTRTLDDTGVFEIS